jgi:hypothetical protein
VDHKFCAPEGRGIGMYFAYWMLLAALCILGLFAAAGMA